MKRYTIELTKTIVVDIIADNKNQAVESATQDKSGYDGAWDKQEPSGKVIGIDKNIVSY